MAFFSEFPLHRVWAAVFDPKSQYDAYMKYFTESIISDLLSMAFLTVSRMI